MERDLGSLILATDISRQNDYLSRFRLHLDQENLYMSTASHRHFVLQVSVGLKKSSCISANSRFIFIFAFPMQMALKCADICNPCRPWELSKQWSEKVTEEFFQQGYLSIFFPYLFCSFFSRLEVLSFFLFIKVFVTLLQETLRRSTNLKSAHFATERWTQSATFK